VSFAPSWLILLSFVSCFDAAESFT